MIVSSPTSSKKSVAEFLQPCHELQEFRSQHRFLKSCLFFLVLPASPRDNHSLKKSFFVNPPAAHADLLATYQRAKADADHKFGLIKKVAAKGPGAIQAAVDTAAKAAKRKDSYAAKLAQLGIDVQG